MPPGQFPIGRGLLSPDGKQIVFEFNNINNQGTAVYSYSLDGSNLTKLADVDYSLQGTY